MSTYAGLKVYSAQSIRNGISISFATKWKIKCRKFCEKLFQTGICTKVFGFFSCLLRRMLCYNVKHKQHAIQRRTWCSSDNEHQVLANLSNKIVICVCVLRCTKPIVNRDAIKVSFALVFVCRIQLNWVPPAPCGYQALLLCAFLLQIYPTNDKTE